MINLKQFLLDSNIDFGTYALVFRDNKIEPTWFTKYDFKGEDWFLESPCELYKVIEVRDTSDQNLIEYLKELLSNFNDDLLVVIGSKNSFYIIDKFTKDDVSLILMSDTLDEELNY